MFQPLFEADGNDSVDIRVLNTEIADESCNSNGFNTARTGAMRTQSLIGLFIVFNHQNIKLVRRYLNAKSNAAVANLTDSLREQWQVDISIVDDMVVLKSLGPLFSADFTGFIKVAFPSGKMRLSRRVYQVI
jgi:hypothetical protein